MPNVLQPDTNQGQEKNADGILRNGKRLRLRDLYGNINIICVVAAPVSEKLRITEFVLPHMLMKLSFLALFQLLKIIQFAHFPSIFMLWFYPVIFLTGKENWYMSGYCHSKDKTLSSPPCSNFKGSGGALVGKAVRQGKLPSATPAA